MRMGAPDETDAPTTTHRGAAIYGISELGWSLLLIASLLIP